MKTSSKIHFHTVLLLVCVATWMRGQNPNWILPPGVSFEYSANLIASLEYNDLATNNPDNQLAFFKGSEVRGLGTPISMGNGEYLYFVTLFAHQAIDTLSIRVYHQETDEVYEVLHPFIFQSQAISGSFEAPFVIGVYPDNNAPIYLLPVPSKLTLEGWPFEAVDMNDYLIQPDGYPVDWSFVSNPNLQVVMQGSTLNVTGTVGFTGTTQLTVRATEITPIAQTRDRGERMAPAAEYFAETVITYTIDSLYAAPLWQPVIPHQGIAKGQTFDDTALGDFENQYTKDTIGYDYLPKLTVANPAENLPNWQVDSIFPTNMSLICRPMFTPKHTFYHADDRLAAFVDNEIRGLCQRNETDHLFYLSIGGQVDDFKKITLKLYSGEMQKTWVMDSAFYFEPYAILGSPSAPHDCDFSPVVPELSDSLAAGGLAEVSWIIKDTSFTGSLTFTFIAKDPDYPLYLNDSIDVNLCIVNDVAELSAWYEDADGDGLGNASQVLYACIQPQGYVSNDDDCNDEDPVNTGFALLLEEESGLANDGMICQGAVVTLTAQIAASSYLWSNGATTPSILVTPNTTSTFSVTVTFATGCAAVKADTVEVEGTIVRDSSNAGPGTLRNVLGCALEGTNIGYDYPEIKSSVLTAPILIDKNVTITGLPGDAAEIKLSNANGLIFIQVLAGKTLGLDHIDIKVPDNGGNAIFFGAGKVDIFSSTAIGKY